MRADKVALALSLWSQLASLNFAPIGKQASQYSGDLWKAGIGTHDILESILCDVWKAIKCVDGRKGDVHDLIPHWDLVSAHPCEVGVKLLNHAPGCRELVGLRKLCPPHPIDVLHLGLDDGYAMLADNCFSLDSYVLYPSNVIAVDWQGHRRLRSGAGRGRGCRLAFRGHGLQKHLLGHNESIKCK